MNDFQTDWILVCAAFLANYGIHCAWYSKWLFADRNSKKNAKPLIDSLYILVSSFLLAYFLSLFQSLLAVTDVTDGVFLGFLVWIGFFFAPMLDLAVRHKISLRSSLVDGSCKLLSMTVMSGIISA